MVGVGQTLITMDIQIVFPATQAMRLAIIIQDNVPTATIRMVGVGQTLITMDIQIVFPATQAMHLIIIFQDNVPTAIVLTHGRMQISTMMD